MAVGTAEDFAVVVYREEGEWQVGLLPERHRLVGSRSERVFALGDAITVRLVEADGIGGRLIFGLDEGPLGRPTRIAGQRGRPFGKGGGLRRGRGPRDRR